MGMLSARAAPLRTVIQSRITETTANFFNIIWFTFGPTRADSKTTRVLEPGGRMKSDSKRLKARNNPNWSIFKLLIINILIFWFHYHGSP